MTTPYQKTSGDETPAGVGPIPGRPAIRRLLRRSRLPRNALNGRLGRNRAVAWVFGLRLSGRFAWLLWLLAHIVFLVGGRNRASVFLNWIYHYFSYDLGLRSIVGARQSGAHRAQPDSEEHAA